VVVRKQMSVIGVLAAAVVAAAVQPALAGQSGWDKSTVAGGWGDAPKTVVAAPKEPATKATASAGSPSAKSTPAEKPAAAPKAAAEQQKIDVPAPAAPPAVAVAAPAAEKPVTPAPAAPAPGAKPAASTPAQKAGESAEGVVAPKPAAPAVPATPAAAPAEEQARAAAASPLTIRLGDADFLLGGFMDMTAVMRSTNVGSGIGTSFGSIPFNNAPQGQLSETRMSAQNSRVSLQATSKVGSAAVKGYVEADFLGNAPANLNVTSNANTMRLRLYWVQYVKGKFELLGGQSWSFMTPNRNGVSPSPGDLFFSQNMDTNYQVGLTWARQAQVRLIEHFSKTLAAGVSVENPQQYVGGAVTLPSSFNGAQVDVSGNTATPNPYPDVIGKVAYDPQTGSTHQHIEVVGLVRGFKTYNMSNTTSYSATGHGASVNVNLEPVKGVHVIGNTFYSDGGGRYIFGLGPDFIVNGDGSPSLVGAKSSVGGIEYQAGAKTQFFGYYGLAKFDQTISTDSKGASIGYGVPGATAANKRIDESTVGINRAFFREARYGALQLIVQYSYLTRTPWSVPAGTPAEAKAHMMWVNVRYVLP
jgi:hypothetical protein